MILDYFPNFSRIGHFKFVSFFEYGSDSLRSLKQSWVHFAQRLDPVRISDPSHSHHHGGPKALMLPYPLIERSLEDHRICFGSCEGWCFPSDLPVRLHWFPDLAQEECRGIKGSTRFNTFRTRAATKDAGPRSLTTPTYVAEDNDP